MRRWTLDLGDVSAEVVVVFDERAGGVKDAEEFAGVVVEVAESRRGGGREKKERQTRQPEHPPERP